MSNKLEISSSSSTPPIAILRPYLAAEAISISEAAAMAHRKVRTMHNWVNQFRIGRAIGGKTLISKVALSMKMEGDPEALELYLSGDRTSPQVVRYYTQLGLPIPVTINGGA